MEPGFKLCPYCAEEIKVDAIKCKHCGEILDPTLKAERSIPKVDNPAPIVHQPQPQVIINAPRERKWSPGVAAVLSFLIPGLGQMYKGNIIGGLLWLVFVVIGYMFLLLPGIILHLCCIITAASGDPYK